MRRRHAPPRVLACLAAAALVACGDEGETPMVAGERGPPADLLIRNARVYTLDWPDPARDGAPDPAAPHGSAGWRPDAGAIAVRDGRIVYVGGGEAAEAYRGPITHEIDAGGATVLPGLVDSHVHIADLGARLERVDLVGADTEGEVVARVAERAADVPAGEWILGWGWDEGAWADRYPTHEPLSEAVPDHPVLLRGLHGFATWANELAMERAGIHASTGTPSGGEILRDPEGRPTGIFLNRATALFEGAVPSPSPERLQARVVSGLRELARAGYVMVHEAGADSALMYALRTLEGEGRLPIRVYAMLSARDPRLLDRWRARGPDPLDGLGVDERLITRAVKGHYDGALGSRGALLLEDYADRPGHRGTGSEGYGYDHERVALLARDGFQPAIHAIGDRANREVLDLLASAVPDTARLRALRPRIEHAQVVHPDDFDRFAALGVIASMQPPHMAEDKAWAEQRLGAARVRRAYAWRTFREHGVPLVLSSDLPGSDHDPFYGLHAAVTRRDAALRPPGGWYPGQALTPEEAVRGYTSWAAWAAGLERETGVIARGRWADLTIVDVDPMATPVQAYEEVLGGRALFTIVAGEIVHESPESAPLAGRAP